MSIVIIHGNGLTGILNKIHQYKKQYDANKAHTRANLLYYLQVFDREDLIADIKKDVLDDLADSFMQALAFHYLVRPKLNRRRNLVPPLTA